MQSHMQLSCSYFVAACTAIGLFSLLTEIALRFALLVHTTLCTQQKRDECMVLNGEEKCGELIEAHKRCLRKEGFNV
jgi:Cytochrome C oxidase copper chaperone (COX17)